MFFGLGKKKLQITKSMNEFEEIDKKTEWLEGDAAETLSVEEITLLAKHGLGRCEDFCFSRSVCGEDACACVRNTFPTPQHYEVYQDARNFYLNALAKAAFAALVGEGIKNGETYDN